MKEIEKRLDVNSQDSIFTPETRCRDLKVNVELKDPGGVVAEVLALCSALGT